MRTSPAILMACAIAAPIAAANAAPTIDDLVYATVGGQPLHMDLFLPDAGVTPDTGAPIVISIHGGGWSGGTYNGTPVALQSLTQEGIAVASIQYRLTSQAGQWGSESVTFPAQIHDVKAAIRYLRGNAESLNLDPDRIITWGGSAGGHLALMAALAGPDAGLEGAVGDHTNESSIVHGAVSLFGPTELLTMNDDAVTPPGSTIDHDSAFSPESRLVGWSAPGQGLADIKANLNNPSAPYPELVALAADASPTHHADANDPPILMLHGALDTSVPMKQSVRLQTVLRAVGVDAQFEAVLEAGHGVGFGPAENQLALQWVRDRFEALKPIDPACAADINNDGAVDLMDLNLLLGGFGSGCEGP